MNKYLDIQTPDEYFQGKYIETSMGKDFAYVRETFYDFVKNITPFSMFFDLANCLSWKKKV